MSLVNGFPGRVLFPALFLPFMVGAAAAAMAQSGDAKSGQPTDAKARRTFAGAIEWQRQGNSDAAIRSYRKANKQDGGNCMECLDRAYELATEIGDYRVAREVAEDGLAGASADFGRANMHFRLGMAWQNEGIAKKKEMFFATSCDEFKSALALDPKLASVHYAYGVSMAYLHQDEAARAEFNAFLDQGSSLPALQQRAQRYLDRVDLARTRMAPPLILTALDGRRVSLDSLAGKVVLIDFWATWCGPCVEALPRLRKIVQNFQGQPFVALSISLDEDQAKWKEFVAKYKMTWLQYREGGFSGPTSTLFGVREIPATFSVDADGGLEDVHLDDADIENKLQSLIAQAVEREKPVDAAGQAQHSGK